MPHLAASLQCATSQPRRTAWAHPAPRLATHPCPPCTAGRSVQQAPEGAVTTLLPLGAWSRISIQAGDVYAEAGVLVEGKDADQARVSMRRYVGLALERAALGTEQRGA